MKAKLVLFGLGIGDYTAHVDEYRMNGISVENIPTLGKIYTIEYACVDCLGKVVDVVEPLYRPDGSLMNENQISLDSFEIIEREEIHNER